ncbi:MAG: YfhO family protein, partial [Saccharofermentans sp.]|nr:YfhO family protein [Saccharofermentans sp.]
MKKKSNNPIIWGGTAFLVSSLIMFLVVRLISISFGMSAQFFCSIESQLDDIRELRGALSHGRIYIHDCIADILTDHLYPSFILALLFGGKVSEFLIELFFYLRFGFMALSINWLLVNNFRLNKWWALILSQAYALSSLSLASCTNPLLMNLMIIMPMIASATETLVREQTPKSFLKSTLVFSLLMTAGIQGIVTGVIFIFALLFLLSALVPNARITKGFISLGLSIIPMMLVIIPTVASGMNFINILSAFKLGHVFYTTFDLLTSFLDGVAIVLPPYSSFVPVGLSILVFILVLFFFMNGGIPFKAKFTSLIIIILFLVSCCSSTLSTILSVFGYESAGAFMRMSALSVILFILACISIKNIDSINEKDSYKVTFILISLICISNVSSASEVIRSPYYLYFSALVIVLWGIVLRKEVLNDNLKQIAIVCIGIIGLTVNLFHTLIISSFMGELSTIKPYEHSSSMSHLTTSSQDMIPLCGNDSEFIVVEQDLRSNNAISYPEVLNSISNGLFLQDLYSNTDTFCVFSSGVIMSDDGYYSVVVPSNPIEILIRCEEMNPNANYYVCSSFIGNTSLSETISGEDVISEYTSPFMRKINRGLSTTLRLVGTPINQ